MEYRQALLLHPNYEQALNNLGNLLQEKGRYTEALAMLRKAVDIRSILCAKAFYISFFHLQSVILGSLVESGHRARRIGQHRSSALFL